MFPLYGCWFQLAAHPMTGAQRTYQPALPSTSQPEHAFESSIYMGWAVHGISTLAAGSPLRLCGVQWVSQVQATWGMSHLDASPLLFSKQNTLPIPGAVSLRAT